MRKVIEVSILLLILAVAALGQAPAQCRVTKTFYTLGGQPDKNATVTVFSIQIGGTGNPAYTSGRMVLRTDSQGRLLGADGVTIGVDLPQGAIVRLYSGANAQLPQLAANANAGTQYQVPNKASANLDELIWNLATIKTKGGLLIGGANGIAFQFAPCPNGQVMVADSAQPLGWQCVTVGGTVSSVFGRVGAVAAQSGDYQFNQIGGTLALSQVNTAGASTNYVPTFNGSTVVWAAQAGGGAVDSVFGRDGAVTAQSGDYTFAQIASTPTTLAGYGITDAYPLSGNPSGFLTGNQTVTLSGDVSGSGATAITATISNLALNKLAALTANRALASNGSGVIAASSVTATELGYLSGATSALQTQLDGKAATSHTHAAADINDSTQSGRALLTAATSEEQRAFLSLEIDVDVQAHSTDLSDIAALSPSNDDVLQRKAGAWTNRTIAQLRSDFALASIATSGSASDLSAGTVPDARFPATLPAASGVNLTALNASNLASGTVPLARLSGITTAELSATAGITNAQLAGSIAISKLSITGTPDGTKFLRDDGSWQAAGGGGLTVGTTAINSGTNTRVLYNNSGVLGEYTVTGTGNAVLSASPTLSGTAALASATLAGTITQTSNSAAAFESGPNGSTNPVIRVVNNVASAQTGLEIKGNAAGSGATLSVLSSGATESLILSPKGGNTHSVNLGYSANVGGSGIAGIIANLQSADSNSSLFIRSKSNGKVMVGDTGFSTPFVVLWDGNLNGMGMSSGYHLTWTDSSTNALSTRDTSLSRLAASVVRVGNGSTGAGQLLLGTSSETCATGTGQLCVYSANTSRPVLFTQAAAGTAATQKQLIINDGSAAEMFSVRADGGLAINKTITGGGTTGAQTINKPHGSVNFAASDTSLVVTNSLVATTSNVVCTIQTNDATMTSVQCVPGSGSFTIYANAAATAETRVGFVVLN